VIAPRTSSPLLSRRQAAMRLGVGPRTIAAAIVAGELPIVRIGRHGRIPASAVDRLIAFSGPVTVAGALLRETEGDPR